MAYEEIKLSVGEQASMFMALGKTMLIVLVGMVTAPLRSAHHGASFKQYTNRLMARKLFGSTTLRQQQSMIPGSASESGYNDFCKKNGLEPHTIDLPLGAKGLWIGKATTSKTLIWFPGGGYVLPITPGHFEYCLKLREAAHKQGVEIAILFISYSLAPKCVYPHQVKESISAVHHAIEKLGKSPEDIILAGDSAGSTLALDVVAHVTHPFPDVPSLPSTARFRGLFLMSAWADFDINKHASYRNNNGYDLATAETYKLWADVYMNGAPHDVWSTPCRAESGWWKNLAVESVLLTAGADECMVDTVKDLAAQLKKDSARDVQIVVGQNECHVAPVSAINFGESGDCETAQAAEAWLLKSLA